MKGRKKVEEVSGKKEGVKEKEFIVKRILEKYPDEKLDLSFKNAFELLVSAILAAQAKDEVVNLVTEKLFQKYKTPQEFANAKLEDLKPYVSKINYWKKKGERIIEASKVIVEKYGGEVPNSISDLTQIKGIGRKTANMILGCAFKIPSIIVDTHVQRVSRRIGLTKSSKPEDIEKDLMNIVPKESWTKFSLALIRHGKNVCKARNPDCVNCFIKDRCEFVL